MEYLEEGAVSYWMIYTQHVSRYFFSIEGHAWGTERQSTGVVFSIGTAILFGTLVVTTIMHRSFQGSAGPLVDIAKFLGRNESSIDPALPRAENAEQRHFSWWYQGKTYALDVTLYASHYRFYRALPTGIPMLNQKAGQDRVWW